MEVKIYLVEIFVYVEFGEGGVLKIEGRGCCFCELYDLVLIDGNFFWMIGILYEWFGFLVIFFSYVLEFGIVEEFLMIKKLVGL